MGVYKREGNNPEHAWNELVRRVNDLADECGFDADLEEVDPNHKWSKSDIRTVQDKLKEICDENEFETIPATWKQSIIDEFMEAIERGCCDCSRSDVLLDTSLFPYTSGTLEISGGTNGLVFLGELDLFGVPFDETIDYTPYLDAIRSAPGAKGKHFWAITRQFDTGVGQGTRFGVIEKDGTLRNPEPLGPAQPGAAGLLGVNGGAVYNFVALCQDFNIPGDPGTFEAAGAATFFNDDPPENFGAYLNDWRTLTLPA